jgi:DNA polymerase
VYRYAEDPTTAVWGFAWRIGDGPINQWRPEYADPIELLNLIASGEVVVAHNAAFERTIWNEVLLPRYVPHWPRLHLEQQDCTLARAAAVAHPQSLDTLCKAVNSSEKKDAEGHALMMKMSRPRKLHPDGSIEWWDQPENVTRLMVYCEQDVRTECEIDTKIPPLTDAERKVWQFDQRINERGIFVDMPAVQKCTELVEYAKKQADKEMRTLTDRAVPKCSNDKSIIEWISSRGIECTTVKKGAQEDLLFMADLHNDPLVREVIELRSASKKTSTAKYKAMQVCVSSDSRIKGLLAYHGAAPGRWAGRLVQPQNFPRVDYDMEGYIIDWLHELLAEFPVPVVYDHLTAVHGPSSALRILSRALRSMVRAAPGNKLIGGDFANIEGRVNAWLAGEDWKLQAFRDYDTITGVDKKGKPLRAGPDLYNLAYAKSFGLNVADVTKAQRQIGKVEELALGYQGSVGAFIDMGDTYGLNPYDITAPIKEAANAYQWEKTCEQYAKKGTNRYDLKEDQWVAIKIIVDNWRAANPAIVQSWWDYQDAAVAAVSTPGTMVSVTDKGIGYYSDGRCLWCVLPCGRMLCYAAPQIEKEIVIAVDKNGEEYERVRFKVKFWGVNSETRQWTPHYLYGGLQCENIVQATARDVMVDRMFAVEDAGYPIILTVHDEIVAEVSKLNPQMNDKEFERIMSILPSWADGLPLAAAAWEDDRYVK